MVNNQKIKVSETPTGLRTLWTLYGAEKDFDTFFAWLSARYTFKEYIKMLVFEFEHTGKNPIADDFYIYLQDILNMAKFGDLDDVEYVEE